MIERCSHHWRTYNLEPVINQKVPFKNLRRKIGRLKTSCRHQWIEKMAIDQLHSISLEKNIPFSANPLSASERFKGNSQYRSERCEIGWIEECCRAKKEDLRAIREAFDSLQLQDPLFQWIEIALPSL
jgi:hypothetical protein